MSIKITIPNSSSDVLTFGSGNTPTAAQIAGIDSGSSNGQLALYTTASGTSTERVRVDASGNVGIGTSSPSQRLHVSRSESQTQALFQSGQAAAYVMIADSGSASTTGQGIGSVGDNLVLRTNSLERMRIDSSGNLLVGKTAASNTTVGATVVPSGEIQSTITTAGGASQCIFLNRQDTTGTAILFRQANNSVGSVSVTGSATAYNTSSDYRLKHDIQPMTGALAKIQALNPVTYKWKADGSDGEGFIAHELQTVVPQCVTGEKDAVDADGNPVYQGIDTSFLVATLTAAIKEQQALIQTLTDRITALENK